MYGQFIALYIYPLSSSGLFVILYIILLCVASDYNYSVWDGRVEKIS